MRGATFLAASAVLGVSACGAESELQIRSLPSPISATAKPVELRLAEANGPGVVPKGSSGPSAKCRRDGWAGGLLRQNGSF
jgi:hypothetical protein